MRKKGAGLKGMKEAMKEAMNEGMKEQLSCPWGVV